MIDAVANTVIDTVPVGVRPIHVEVSPDGQRVYVSNQGSDTVSVIDVASHAVVATFGRGQYAPTIAWSGRRYEDGRGSAQWTTAAPTGGIAYLARIT